VTSSAILCFAALLLILIDLHQSRMRASCCFGHNESRPAAIVDACKFVALVTLEEWI
jgi:hypothetical protein